MLKGIYRLRSGISAVMLGVASLVLGTLGTAPVYADDGLQTGQSALVTGTEGRGLKVRAGPGMSHGVVTTVNEGATVQISAGPVSDGDDDWYQISVSPTKTG